jgi:hypothetical protein
MTDHPPDENGNDTSGPPHNDAYVYEIRADESHSQAVVRAVASVTNTSGTNLEQLYEAIDPEHLNGLFDGNLLPGSRAVFHYNGCQVSVTPDTVRVSERNKPDTASDTTSDSRYSL